MLVLTRKPGEVIQIGDSIIVEVAEVKGKRVRLAIKAPDEVEIRRGELEPKTLQPVKMVSSNKPVLSYHGSLRMV